ncbi:unnamed protein product [Kuraishia capsulata CBS 1993]|uniref:2-(3-amino-3-carboxypropyl)histidine synthase subunit 2 n=1 Tax=Kuraishia capsulata CBS 1993 TaxID=1382522 RepID=W6MFC4_9ASCO|nr:uncharacterized protein KUCA_T00000176001 [Kuraishia capsulata CBS 1993]CDK24216.1 unnamed protein product [Kuraishia capsulata CBS 1993]
MPEMPEDNIIVAPALSTAQDEQEVFMRFSEKRHDRPHLNQDGVHTDEDLFRAISDYYSIPELAQYLSSRGSGGELTFQSITLQFPDHLIQDSAIVSKELQSLLSHNTGSQVELHTETSPKEKEPCGGDSGCKKCADCEHGSDIEDFGAKRQKLWILADTSYSTCCVDEIAAEHVNSDVVVHFGDSCLTPVDKLKTVYVFGKAFLDHDQVISRFKETYPDTDSKVVLMSDTTYSHHLEQLHEALLSEYPRLAYAAVPQYQGKGAIIPTPEWREGGLSIANRLLQGIPKDDFNFLDEEDYSQVTLDYQLFHIGEPQTPRLLLLSTLFSSIVLYDVAKHTTSNGPYPSLQRRYRSMHVARTAGTVGILVNTLSLENTKTVLNTVVKWIRNAGKKHYMFVVGKPNVAKLSNFEAVDVWCVLGCSQSGTIVDNSGEYYKPIITPYELKLALAPEVTWTGKWVTDFKSVLDLDEDEDMNDTQESPDPYKDESAPEFDPVTGKYISSHAPLRQLQHLQIEIGDDEPQAGQLVKKLSSAVAIKGTVSTSAIQLQSREWTGLGSDYQNEDQDFDEEGAVAVEGRNGIARGYSTGGQRY